MPLTAERLRDVVTELATRPGHEKVRALVYQLLVDGLGASSTEVDFERPVPEVHGRIDALLGRTVFEFKADLRRELRDAERKLPDYLSQREAETGEHFVGITADGAMFIPYKLRAGKLRQLPPHTTSVEHPRDLLAWLSSAVAVSADLEPTPETVQRELGRNSLAWFLAREELATMWGEVGSRPEVRLKRDLWAQLMERVYGATINQDDLFFQHTYLTTIAKTMATHVLGIDVPDPAELLAGRRFQEAGITGAVESDFFDWVLSSSQGSNLVHRIALQAGRFLLRNVQADVLKGLYESLIDPQQRHDLGEYYTPDWLAQRMCAHAIERPLEQRVLDPACGSGTFLFHAVRRLLDSAEAEGLSNRDAVQQACQQVFGIDVHPVSVQIARVTYLLALGEERLRERPPNLTIPVYMGDSLQWNTQGFLAERAVLIEVPGEDALLEFPFEVARDPGLFDAVIGRMLQLSRENAPSDGLKAWLERTYDLSGATTDRLAETYEMLRQLHHDERDHVWGFVARNLVRPVWSSQEEQRADVVIGNPPWLSYRYMDGETQRRFREECQLRGLWMGQVAQQQDLSAYFFVRCVELYLKPTGVIAFIMPYGAMSRRQFAGFRTGWYEARRKVGSSVFATVKFVEAWVFDEGVQPLFPVPSCVLMAKSTESGPLPKTVTSYSGTLPRRDAPPAEAQQCLTWREIPWPSQREKRVTAGYAGRFRDGAVVFPSVLFRVQLVEAGILGPNPNAPLVESRRTRLEKPPWKGVPTLRRNVEAEFLGTLYLGESVAPFRLLEPILAVVPCQEDGELLDSAQAQRRGYAHLAGWLAEAEQLWAEHGRGRRSLLEQLDYYGQLTSQFPTQPIRVVYTASGTLPAAALLSDARGVVEHKLYWASVGSESEGRYLLAILNSETAHGLVEHLQSRGQWGARDFDKVMLSLPIPLFNPSVRLHQELAEAARHAEEVAAAVPLKEGTRFVRARQLIRQALQEDGVDARINNLVAELLS
ncbi:MAG: N-6 DNA methylase [Chloroflexi bacterium]|nr:N-6 DNA methylase [Chloroflexota bacterium]